MIRRLTTNGLSLPLPQEVLERLNEVCQIEVQSNEPQIPLPFDGGMNVGYDGNATISGHVGPNGYGTFAVMVGAEMNPYFLEVDSSYDIEYTEQMEALLDDIETKYKWVVTGLDGKSRKR